MAKNYPKVKWDKYHIDILTANFVLHPDWFDVVVGSNLFGDILSDLGPACTGTIGIAPSGNINPEGQFPVGVRAGARLGARYRGAGHRQSDRHDLVGRDDAGASRREAGGGSRSSARSSARSANARCAPAISAATPTPAPAARRSRRWWIRVLLPSPLVGEGLCSATAPRLQFVAAPRAGPCGREARCWRGFRPGPSPANSRASTGG